MRKLIVKYFALSYSVQVFGKRISWLRAANVIVPLLCLTALAFYFNAYTAKIITVPLLVLSIFFGFVYFVIRPVQWYELDIEQKVFFGSYKVKNSETFSELNEWKFLKKRYKNRGLLLLFLNPFICILTALIILFF